MIEVVVVDRLTEVWSQPLLHRVVVHVHNWCIDRNIASLRLFAFQIQRKKECVHDDVEACENRNCVPHKRQNVLKHLLCHHSSLVTLCHLSISKLLSFQDTVNLALRVPLFERLSFVLLLFSLSKSDFELDFTSSTMPRKRNYCQTVLCAVTLQFR
ncbi:MAG: hypothetical protein RLZZ76_579 [Candidatus Parcubacteria bacterium]